MKQPNTMLAVITTKYAGPTDHKGSRILVTVHLKADGSTFRNTQSWLHSYGVHDNHQSAAKHALWDVSSGLLPGAETLDDITVDGWTHDGVGHWVATVKAKVPRSAVVTPSDKVGDLVFNIGHSAGILGNYPENYLTAEERGSHDGKAMLEVAAEVRRLADWMSHHHCEMRAG